MTLSLKFLCLVICFSYSNQITSQSVDDIIGIYLIDEGDSKVEIFESEKGISGKVAWLEKEENGLATIEYLCVLDEKGGS